MTIIPYVVPTLVKARIERTLQSARKVGSSPLTLATVLLAYGNGSAWLATRRAAEVSLQFNWAHMAMLALTLLWAAVDRVGSRELGCAAAGFRRSLVYGAMAGGLGALGIGVLSLLPALRKHLTVPEVAALSRGGLLRLLCGQLLLGSALFEEIAFRGLLQEKFARALGPGRALLAESGVFVLWHAVIVWHNVGRYRPLHASFTLVYGTVLSVLFVAGLALGWLRQHTGNLAGPTLTHWLVLVAIVLRLRSSTSASASR